MTESLGALLAERAWLEGLARSLVHGHDADELVQDTLATSLQRAARVVTPRAWLAAVAQNRARQRARGEARRRRREERVARPEATAEAAPDEVVARFDVQRRVASAVHALDEPFRTTVLLHHFEGLALAEVARRQGVPDGTVRWRLHRAHALLRERLQATLGSDWRTALLPLCGLTARRSATLLFAVAATVLLGAGGALLLFASNREGVSDGPATAAAAAPAERRPAEEETASTGDRSPASAAPAAAGAPSATIPVAESTARDQQAIVRLRVAGEDGAVIESARARVVDAWVRDVRVAAELLAQLAPAAETGAEGHASFLLRAPAAALASLDAAPALAPGELWRLVLRVEANGHVPAEREVFVADGDDRDLGVWVLRRASTLVGEVVDAHGAAVSGAELGLDRAPLPDDPGVLLAGGGVPRGRVLGRSNGGAFRLEGVEPGPVLLLVAKEGVGQAHAWLRLQPGENRAGRIELRAPRAAPPPPAETEMRVRVLDAFGSPVAGAQVVHWTDAGSGMTTTRRDGFATLHLFGDAVTHVDLAALTDDGRAAHAPRVPSTESETILHLRPAREVRVRITASDGTPVPGATTAIDVGGRGMQFPCGRQQADGSIVLAQPPLPARLVVAAPAHARHVEPLRAAGAWPDDLAVVLRPLRTLRGVVRAAGRPIAGVRVRLCSVGEIGLRDGFRSSLGGSMEFATSAADGTFEFTREEAETLVLLADHAGFAPAALELGTFDPAVGRSVEIELGAGRRVRGQIRREDGTPLPRAVVALAGDLHGARTVVADLEGRFAFDQVAPGAYELRPARRMLSPSSFSFLTLGRGRMSEQGWSNLTVPEGGAGEDVEQDIVVDRCRLDGRLVDPSTDFRGFSAELVLPHDDQAVCERAALDAAGRFALSSFTAGRHRLRVRAPGGAFGDLEITRDLALDAGENHAAVALSLAAWRGEIPAAFREGRHELLHERDGWQVRTHLHAGDDGSVHAPKTPVGDAWLRRVRADGVDRIRLETIVPE